MTRPAARALLWLSAALLAVTVVGAAAQPERGYGADTPQAVVAGLSAAAAAEDFATAMTFIAPDARRTLAHEMLQGVLFGLALANPDDRMPGSPALSKADLQKKRAAYKAAVDTTRTALTPAGLAGVIGQKPMAPGTVQAVERGLATADTVVLVRDLAPAIAALDALLGEQAGMTKAPFPFAFGAVSGYRVQGERATAKAATEPLEFVRVGGRWYLTPPQRP